MPELDGRREANQQPEANQQLGTQQPGNGLLGRVVLITGAAGNLGRATTRAFAAAGARLALVGRIPDTLREVAESAGARDAALLAADLTRALAVEEMAETAVARLGSIDVVAHLAGGFRSGTPLWQTPDETFDIMLGLNLRAFVNTARAVVPHMLRRGRGALVCVAAQAGERGEPGLAAYSASKGAAIRAVESLAAELLGMGVRANCVLPASIESDAHAAAIADLIVFLASDSARAVSGASLAA